MSWFKKLLPKVAPVEKKGVPEGVWSQCSACHAVLYRAELARHLNVCPKCDHHLRLTANERLDCFLDKEARERLAEDIVGVDRLKFKDSKRYKDRLSTAQKKSKEKEALVVMKGQVNNVPLVACAFDFDFIGGSMSAGVGSRFVAAAQSALANRLPLVCFATSGGARMQEGLFSLFQMGKTATVVGQMNQNKLPFISVLTDPTMGGVSASFATLGDIIIAEPKALIGFSGPRVIEQTIRQVLPEGFQRSEFLLEHGAIDMIVDRRDLRDRISALLAKLTHYVPQ